jgi:Na+/proline symporter
LLGIFLVGLLTKNRGSDNGNLIAMCVGVITVAIFSGVPDLTLTLLTGPGSASNLSAQIPQIAFPYRILVGALTTFGCACLFRSEKKA